MYFEVLGEFFEQDNELLYVNESRNQAFRITGEDSKLLKKVLPLCTGTIRMSEMAQELNLDPSQLLALFDQFVSLHMARVNDQIEHRATITTRNIPQIYMEQIRQQKALINWVTCQPVDELEHPGDLLIAIDYEKQGDDFFYEVERKATHYKIPWLKISVCDPYLYSGPVFFPDGSPCFSCYSQRIQLNSPKTPVMNSIGTMGPIESLIPLFLEREIIKFFKQNTPIALFEKEIIINTRNYETSSYQVLQMPTCMHCKQKGKIG